VKNREQRGRSLQSAPGRRGMVRRITSYQVGCPRTSAACGHPAPHSGIRYTSTPRHRSLLVEAERLSPGDQTRHIRRRTGDRWQRAGCPKGLQAAGLQIRRRAVLVRAFASGVLDRLAAALDLAQTIIVASGPEFAAPLHSARQPDRKRVRRKLQRQVSGRLSERTLLCAWPTQRRDRNMARLLQPTVRPHRVAGWSYSLFRSSSE
jgi:hypothetical protein